MRQQTQAQEPRSQTVTARVDHDMFQEIEEIAVRERRNRSQVVKILLEDALAARKTHSRTQPAA